MAVPKGGARGDYNRSPISRKLAKIVKEKWHRISWGILYLKTEKLRQNPPPFSNFSELALLLITNVHVFLSVTVNVGRAGAASLDVIQVGFLIEILFASPPINNVLVVAVDQERIYIVIY